MSLTVLYEDNHIIVIVKPVNVPSQADETGDADALSLVKAYIKEKYNKPGEVYCGLVHRLDRPVGGVMVFARTSKAASRLAPQFKEKGGAGAKKRYAAIVAGEAPAGGELTGFILKDEATRTSRVVPEGTDGAKEACLSFTRVCKRNGLSLVDVGLRTGRHHQIRVQLSNAGLPIWGDQRYNPSAKPGQQIALWAYSLTIEHPVKHERMTFTALPPEELGAWGIFQSELKGLAAGLPIVYCDNNIIIVNKPAGLTVAIADGGEDTCEGRLRSAFGEAYAVHRLDAATCGLLIFARNAQAKKSLDSAIRDRSVKKVYRLIAAGRPSPAEGRLTLYAEKNAERGQVRVFDKKTANSVEMITDYRVISSANGASLVEAELVTGRTHQIRASFAHIGCPILGDDKYGDREFNRGEYRPLVKKYGLCLCACRIEPAFEKDDPLYYLNGKSFEIEPPFGL